MSPDERPPEAELLRRARVARHLSIRVAAEHAGVSAGRWRQVEAGYQTVRAGVRVPATATPATLAHMAKAVSVPPERLEQAGGNGREAAVILRDILQGEAPRPGRFRLIPGEGGAFTDIPERPGALSERDLALVAEILRPDMRRLAARIDDAGPDTDGRDIFEDDPRLAQMWMEEGMTAAERLMFMALRQVTKRARAEEARRAN